MERKTKVIAEEKFYKIYVVAETIETLVHLPLLYESDQCIVYETIKNW